MKWQEAGWRTVSTEGPPASACSFTFEGGPFSRVLARNGRECSVLIVPGLGQIFLVNRVDQTTEGHLRKNGTKIEK